MSKDELNAEEKALQEIINTRCFSFREISELFSQNNWGGKLIELAADFIIVWQNRVYEWDEDISVVNEELIALHRMYKTFSGVLVRQDTISLAIRKPSFHSHFDNPILIGLFDELLKVHQYTENRNVTGEVRKAVSSWIGKCSPQITPDHTFVQITENLLGWWGKMVTLFPSLYEDFAPTMNWIMRINLEAQFSSGFSKKTVTAFPNIFSENFELHPQVFKVFRTLAADIVHNVNLNELVTTLFSTADAVDPKKKDKEKDDTFTILTIPENYKKFSQYHRIMIADIMYYLFNRLEEESEKSDAVEGWYLPSYFRRQRGVDPLNLMLLLRQESNAWAAFLPWYSLETSIATTLTSEGENGEEVEKWGRLGAFSSLVSELVLDAYALISESRISVEFVAQLVSAVPSLILISFTVAGCPLEYSTLEELSQFTKNANKELLSLKDAVNLFMDKTNFYELSIKPMENTWRTNSIRDIKAFFRIIDSPIYNEKIQIPPVEILKSYRWLCFLKNSDLFKFIFANSENESQFEKLIPASKTWATLFSQFTSNTISFGTLEHYYPFLNLKEMKFLFRATFSVENTTWKVINLEQEIFDVHFHKLEQWIHLKLVKELQAGIHVTLNSMKVFSSVEAISEIKTKEKELKLLLETLPEDWNAITIAELSKYSPFSELFHPCLLRVSPELLKLASESVDLFRWLRDIRNDADFTSSVEMAMGKGEMDCPVELWQEEPGKPGRPDEEKLSMVTSVRSYLHGIIYRPEEKFVSYDQIIEVLNGLRESDPAPLITSISVCNEYSAPLMEILISEGDNSPEKLGQLFIAGRNAVWICSNDEKDLTFLSKLNKNVGTKFQYWLQWSVPRKNDMVFKALNQHELLDFQSSLVLSKTDDRSAFTQSLIDKFINQLGWIKELFSNVQILYNSGNFDYQSYRIELSIDTEPVVIRDHALITKKNMQKWEDDVMFLKSEYYYLNFFTVKQLWKIVVGLRSSKESVECFNTLQSVLQMISIRSSYTHDELDHFISTFTMQWCASFSPEMTGFEIVQLLGKIFDNTLSKITPSRRSLFDSESREAILSPGIHLTICDDASLVMDSILGLYYRCSILPENENIYMCKLTTTFEELLNIVNRWKKSHLNNREKQLYCIGYAHLLNFELQQKLVVLLKSSEPLSQNPLVIVSFGKENQYLISQYSHKRTNFNVIPTQELFALKDLLSSKYSRGVDAYYSRHAGAGKTFNIRSAAYSQMLHYIHFPIYNTNRLVERLTEAIQEYSSDEILLHIDLSDALVEDLNPFLFDLVYLGIVLDSSSGSQFCWNPFQMCICLEVASGNLIKKLRICELLNPIHVIVSPENFRTDYEDLIAGMGEEFDSPRNDGTRLRKEMEQELLANSFQRLQYVCLALDMMNKNGGKFPYVYEGANSPALENLRLSLSKSQVIKQLQTTDISNVRSFELLMEAIKLDPTKPSLWCLWNFVNVFYWQLRDMHYPESPINCCCMPDESSEKEGDADLKARIKGEVVQFLIRTAREFATRQIKKEDPNMIVGVYVTGLSRGEWNGFWPRCEFDNDGQPCFGSSSFYLYFRSEENKWVIDDVIEPWGACFTGSVGPGLEGNWKTGCGWERDPQISVRKVRNPGGYNNQGISVSGPPNKQGSFGKTEYGEYIRLPSYDDICGNPHYVKIEGELRRHIFWSDKENLWQVCPVCNNDEGAFGLSSTSNIEGAWQFMPPDKVEVGVKLRMVSLSDKRTGAYLSQNIRGRLVAVQDEPNVVFDENDDDLEKLMDNLLMWNESNHECLLFSNEHHVVSFLSMNPAKMKSRMHPRLLEHLKENKINVGEDLNTVNARFHEILGSLTGVYLSRKEAAELLGGTYCITGDSLLKMLAIFVRSRCGVPVVLMGECGCGKTHLIKYLCAWIKVKLFVLDVHGGTTERDIVKIFEKAELAVTSGQVKESFVFLDEINTCAHMGLLCEVICQRSLFGKRIHEDVKVLAALNPYRRRPNLGHVPGLVFQLHGDTTPDPMANLVYRVHPIPRTLRDFIFDFGSLSAETERLYIFSMVSKKFSTESVAIHNLVTDIILACQDYIRLVEKEPSSTSLRDVERCLSLTEWFAEKVTSKKKNTTLSTFACALVLGLSFVYYYRLNTNELRENLWKLLIGSAVNWKLKGVRRNGFDPLSEKGGFAKVLRTIQEGFCRNIVVEDGIAMNQALMENVFVTIICILNRIPIFVVGKPGSSKTLTMQVIASNLQGKQSTTPFWAKFPAVYIFQYQCSPMSDSHSIQHQFDMAVRYQQHAENTITVLLLDEVGLAEHSPEMPLKVLHGMLVKPPIAIVGLSNWTLDPAKMNRAICLQRTDPSPSDIHLTATRIVSSEKNYLNQWLEPLAKAYHQIYTTQKGREFIGMRDYYSLIKYLKSTLDKQQMDLIPDILTFALCRNFGGKPEIMTNILSTFHSECFSGDAPEVLPPTQDLLLANLNDKGARHLMVLTKNGAALPLMFGANLLGGDAVVLVGSEFKDDKTELHLVQQINEVKLAMASGKTLVLLNHDNIYEALYDVLNQRYLFKKDKTGQVRKMLRLAIGSRSQLCVVSDLFKIVVIVEQDHAYRNLDLPLLNRFEKQVFCASDVLTPNQWKIVEVVREWVDEISTEVKVDGPNELFCGYHGSTIASAVLYLTNFSDNIDGNTVTLVKQCLVRVALPVAVSRSKILQQQGVNYFKEQEDFDTLYNNFVTPSETNGSFSVVLTYSPVIHLDVTSNQITTLLLSQLSSERDLIVRLKLFFDIPHAQHTLIIQCDPITCSQSLINHAQQICVQQRNFAQTDLEELHHSRNIVFIIHLPPGISNRVRQYSLDFNVPWKYYFVDDLRTAGILSTTKLVESSMVDLIKDQSFNIRGTIESKFQYALSFCISPDLPLEEVSFRERISLIRKLLSVPEFYDFILELVILILNAHQSESPIFPHVEIASGMPFGGSFRQNLESSLEHITIQLLAYIFRFLDRDFNFNILRNYEIASKLWFSLVRNPTIYDRESFIFLCKIKYELIPETIFNYGRYHPLIAQFPHSYAIIKVLNSAETRKNIDIGDENERFERCDSTLSLVFGDELVHLVNEFGEGRHIKYLHDYIVINANPLPLHLDILQFLYETVITATNPNGLTSIAKIHVASWMNEERLFIFSSLLSTAPIAIEPVVSTIRTLQFDYALSTSTRLMMLDSCFLVVILESFWNLLINLEDTSTFLTQFSNSLKDLESIILMLVPYEQEPLWSSLTLHYLRLSLLGLMISKLYIQEIIVPNIPHSSIKEIFTHIRSCQPGKLTFLVEILRSVSSDNDPLVLNRFFNRYLQEIVFGVREGFLNFGATHVIEADLMEAINIIVNGGYPSPFVNLTTRKLALYCSIRSRDFLTSPIEITSPEGFLLYLQNYEDILSEVPEFTIENTQITQTSITNALAENNLDAFLINLAKWKHVIMKCSKEASLSDTKSFLYKLPEVVKSVLNQNKVSPLLVNNILKYVLLFGGIDFLGDVLYADKKLNYWIDFPRNQLNRDDSIADTFFLYDSYKSISAAVRKSASSSRKTKELLQYINTLTYDDLRFLFASTFNEFILCPDNHNQTGLQCTKEDIAQVLAAKHPAISVFNWITSNSPFNAVNFLKHNRNTYETKLLLQTIIHVIFFALRYDRSWMFGVLFEDPKMDNSFIPSVSDDEFMQIVQASGYVGWYKCPRGHPYSVGNCTYPMEVSRCLHPGCGAEIGGRNHVAVAGVTRLSAQELNNHAEKVGYDIANNVENCNRMSVFSGRTLRFMLHSIILVRLFISENKKGNIAFVRNKSYSSAINYIWERVQEDWSLLKKHLMIGDTDLNIAIQNFLYEYVPHVGFQSQPHLSSQQRNEFERAFSHEIDRLYPTTFILKQKVAVLKSKLSGAGRATSVRSALKHIWDDLQEEIINPSADELLWKVRLPVSYDLFIEQFNSTKENAELYPTLNDFINEESKLHLVKYIADILVWHGLLFETIPNNSITREEASTITNYDILQKVSENKREFAKAALTRYCIAFNAVFPQVERIFECQDNPYITEDGKVDLSGTKSGESPMCFATPIIYSLPSAIQGEADVPGLCTIQILNLLQNSHNQLLHKFLSIEATDVPPTNYLTPREIIVKRLIEYDRDEKFLPLIRCYSLQGLKLGEGYNQEFDFNAIQQSIRNGILASKMPLIVQIRHYNYRGDVQKSGRLNSLRSKLTQQNISLLTQQTILSEVDTLRQLNKLMSLLEVSINFLTSFSSNVSINPDNTWEEFVVNTLQFDLAVWNDTTTPTISQQICLKHLQSLYLCLEEKMKGNPLDNVLHKYRDNLSDGDEAQLRIVANLMQLDLLLPIIREFLVEELTGDAKWKETENLKIYITFAGEKSNIDLDVDWYEDNFPDSLQLRHTFKVYHILYEVANF